MKTIFSKTFSSFAAAIFCAALASAPVLFSAGVPAKETAAAFPHWASDGDIVPAAGEYVVLISEKTAAKKDWKAAADKFVERYAGKLVVWRGNDVAAAKNALKNARPRYVAVVAAPEEIDRVFIATLHRLSRAMNDDIYGDFLWGIISGRDGATAAKQLAKDAPLVVNRAIGTTNFDQQRFKKSFFITDWAAREYVETQNFVSSEKIAVAAANGDMTEIFARRWKAIDPQLMISSSHATEFNLEMPFGEGLLASAGTDFLLIPKNEMPAFAQTLGNDETRRIFLEKQKAKTLPKTPAEKIWIAAGNCLIGDALRSPDSMVITAISSANVRQFVGYTIPSWFGEGGWGTSDKFFNGHQTTSVGQAWFFNNQILLNALPPESAALSLPMAPLGLSGTDINVAAKTLHDAGIELSRENIGRFYDRDVVAFYGDPLFRARFDPAAPSVPPWKINLKKSDGETLTWELKTTRKDGFKGDFCLWFPARVDAGTPPSVSSARGNAAALSPAIFTENFIVFRNLELGGNDALTFRAKLKKQ